MSHVVRLLVTVLVCLLPSEAAAKWTRLKSENFVFIGDAPAGQIRQVAEKLERFREVLTRALPGATATSPVPTIVVVFATDRAMNPVKPLFRGNTTEVAGYMLSGEDLNYIAINGEYLDIALTTVFHEYGHLMVGNTIGGGVPPWASEGLAQFYEMMQGLDGGTTVVIGRALADHVNLLKSSTLIPIKELLSIDHGSQVYNEGIRRGVFYAQSWALVHYLTLGSKERATQLRQYLSALRMGVEHGKAFADAFGPDTTVLDRELFEYVRQFSFPALRMKFADKIVAETERGTTMDDLDAEVAVGDLQARIGRDEEARPRLQAIVKRKPDAALAWTALGLIEFRARRLEEALTLLERAAQQGPGDAFVQNALGRALIARLNEQTASDARTATLQKARTALARGVELDANSSYAAGMLGYVELAIGDDLPRAVLQLERAVRLAPSREQYRLLLAQALLRQREFERATGHLGTLVATGSSSEIRDDARRLLAVAADARLSTTSAAAPRAGADDRVIALSSLAELVAPSPARSTIRLDLRPVQDGETRTLGLFRAIDCRQNEVVLQVDANGTLLRLGARQMSDIDFITYRTDTAGSVTCGALPTPVRVLATYRITPTSTPGANDGDAVAIELLPDGYTPATSR